MIFSVLYENVDTDHYSMFYTLEKHKNKIRNSFLPALLITTTFSWYFQFYMKTFMEAVFARSTCWNSMNKIRNIFLPLLLISTTFSWYFQFYMKTWIQTIILFSTRWNRMRIRYTTVFCQRSWFRLLFHDIFSFIWKRL